MVDLEERLRAEITRRSWDYEPSPQLPDHIQARVQQRRRSRQLTAGALVLGAAAALVLLIAVLMPNGGDDEGSVIAEGDRRPTTTTATTDDPTTSTATTATAPDDQATSTTTTATTPAETTSPASAAPVTIGELTGLAFPFADGVKALPPACRSYWESLAPETPADFFPPTANGIELVAGSTAIADVDGDGIDDGAAAFHCTYPGSPPSPGGLLVVRAGDRAVVFSRAEELPQANVALTGDPRTVMRAPVTVTPPGQGDGAQIVARVGSYLPDDANAGPSREADARFLVEGDQLRLVALDPA